MKADRLVGVLAAVFLAGAAQAEEAAPVETAAQAPAPGELRGLEIGFRTGFGFALGEATGKGTGSTDFTMSKLTAGQIPLQLDVGYRFDPRFEAGVYFSFGIVPLKKDYACDSTADSCSGNDLRFGIQGQFHPLANQNPIDPWVGLGIGYEVFHLSSSGSSGSSSLNFTGIEFANLALGADFRLSPQFSLGPLLGITLGQYSSASASFASLSASYDLPDKTLHMWLNVGVRGTFNLPLR